MFINQPKEKRRVICSNCKSLKVVYSPIKDPYTFWHTTVADEHTEVYCPDCKREAIRTRKEYDDAQKGFFTFVNELNKEPLEV